MDFFFQFPDHHIVGRFIDMREILHDSQIIREHEKNLRVAKQQEEKKIKRRTEKAIATDAMCALISSRYCV